MLKGDSMCADNLKVLLVEIFVQMLSHYSTLSKIFACLTLVLSILKETFFEQKIVELRKVRVGPKTAQIDTPPFLKISL